MSASVGSCLRLPALPIARSLTRQGLRPCDDTHLRAFDHASPGKEDFSPPSPLAMSTVGRPNTLHADGLKRAGLEEGAAVRNGVGLPGPASKATIIEVQHHPFRPAAPVCAPTGFQVLLGPQLVTSEETQHDSRMVESSIVLRKAVPRAATTAVQ